MNENPDSFLSIQYHGRDVYETTFSWARINFYGVPGYPTTWFDGVLERVGAYTSDTQQYNWYRVAVLGRMTVPTDVTIDVSAREVSELTYEVTTTVGVEAGGQQRSMTLYVVQVLDNYPPPYTDGRYRNCVIKDAPPEDFDLAPGESRSSTWNVTLDGDSASDIEDVKFVAWAQAPGSPPPKEVHQAAFLAYPFVTAVPGDIDGDGDVDLADLAELLAAYGTCEGDAGYNPDADLDGDSCVGLADLATLLANYGHGT